ncbi:MAG: SRPBCC family protein [Bacteroidota bacterium]
MAKMHIERSADIAAAPERVFQILNDFHSWPSWSPWLIADPEANINTAADGKSYAWEGPRTGAGNMQITAETTNEHLAMDLNFLKPWKSKAKVKFNIQATENGSRVNWTMDSSLPIFLFWMKKSMEAYVGSDYERGLSMLKNLAEDGKVHSRLEFMGETDFPGSAYVGIRRELSLDQMQKEMGSDFSQLFSWFKTSETEPTGPGFTIYHKWDMVKRRTAYTAGFPIAGQPPAAPENSNLFFGQLPTIRAYRLRHIGSYHHLGNAWATVQMMIRSKEFKPSKKLHPFELYITQPDQVPEQESITDLYFPLR